MINRSHFIFPFVLLALTLMLVHWLPSWTVAWALIFLIVTAFYFVGAIINRFRVMDALFKKGQYEKVLKQCQSLWEQHDNSQVRYIAGLYLAGSRIAIGGDDNTAKAKEILDHIPVENLSQRFLNHYLVTQAQLCVMESDYQQAYDLLNQATLKPLGMHYVIEMFFLFSVIFTELKKESDRAYQYAAKAFELAPNMPKYHAQFAVCHGISKSKKEGEVMLEEVIPKLPQNTWEQSYYRAKQNNIC